MTRKLFVTNALPYANGPIHLGHLVGYIQADTWTRFQRLLGHHVMYVCADDAHGTPIMLAAQKAGLSPENFIAQIKESHEQDFKEFGVDFDCYHTTHSDENRLLCERIYRVLHEKGFIRESNVEQAYDPVEEMFLPDRYIKGTCPRCGEADQYGDNCEHCGATYEARELKDAVSTLSSVKLEWRVTRHYFFMLSKLREPVENWVHHAKIHPSAKAKLTEWLDAGLKDWDISRDAPYFGFRIPDASDKFFYVWMDAPIGYFASLLRYLEGDEIKLKQVTNAASSIEMWHFIGKDIVNFHGLFWPAVLQGANMRQPTGLSVNGYLTVNGFKMSKSRGTFIRARSYLDAGLDPEYLRYYFATKLGSGIDDVDLNLDDFVVRVNSDLIGKYVNIASRCASFVQRRFNGQLAQHVSDPDLLNRMLIQAPKIASLYDSREFAAAMRMTMSLADLANEAIQQVSPWVIAKDPSRTSELQAVCTTFINAFRLLTLYLKPVLPRLAERAEKFLNIPALNWDNASALLLSHKIEPYSNLLTRVDPELVAKLLELARTDLESIDALSSTTPRPSSSLSDCEQAASIDLSDFKKIELRVARILRAEDIPGADRLLKLILDVGELGQRQVFAGIKSNYAPESLVGRLTIMVANLAPRKMRFGVSEGMVLAASGRDGRPYLVSPEMDAEPGMIVR